MLILQALMHAAMLFLWFAAASYGMPSAMSLRWVALAAAIPVTIFVRAQTSRRTRLPAGSLIVLGLGLYGLVLGTLSVAPALAMSKCLTFTAGTLCFIAGGTTLVERFGRERVLKGWSIVWRVFLVFSVASLLLGRWRTDSAGLYGPTGNPNQYGSMLLSLGLILVLRPEGGFRGWRLVEIGLGCALLLATRARASILAALVAAAVALLLQQGKGRWAWAVALLVAVTGLAMFNTERVTESVVSVTEGRTMGEVAQTRLATWEDSLKGMQAGLPFGLGWGVKAGQRPTWSFDVKTTGYGREEGTSWLPIGEELGIPGFLFFAWLGVVLVRAVRPAPSRPRVLAGAALAGYFTLATFEGWLLSPGNWESAAFWTTIGIVFARPVSTWDVAAPLPETPDGVLLGAGS